MSHQDALRVGVVGLGRMGHHHAENVEALGHDVVAGADVVEEARESFAAEFDAAGYADHERLYEAADPDAVVVATPNAFHAPAVVAALDRNVHVLCEKPLADDLANAERIAEAAAASDAICTIDFYNRFSTAAEIVAAEREAGRFGEITHVEGEYVRRRGIPGIGSWFTNRSLSGGGAVIDVGVHLVDLALHLAGFPEVVEASATTRTNFGDREEYADPDDWAGKWDTSRGGFDVDDSASAFLRCADGTTLALEMSWAANRPPSDEIVLRGTEAGARTRIDGRSLTIYECSGTGADHYSDAEIGGPLAPGEYYDGDEYFLDCVLAGEEPDLLTVEEGLAVQRVVDAIYRSGERGRAVEL